MKIGIYTLGCKVNQYETQAMETELAKRGHILCSFDDFADAYIINTCTVTAVSDHKSRQMIRQAKKRNSSAVIAVCGCYAQTKPQEVAALEADLVGGSAGRIAFLDALEQLAEAKHEDRSRRPTGAEGLSLSPAGAEGASSCLIKETFSGLSEEPFPFLPREEEPSYGLVKKLSPSLPKTEGASYGLAEEPSPSLPREEEPSSGLMKEPFPSLPGAEEPSSPLMEGPSSCAAEQPECGKLMSTEQKTAVQNPPFLKENLEKKKKAKNSDGLSTPQVARKVMVGNIMSTKVFEELPAGGLAGRTRAMLKVEDGCVNFCSYCVIPYARGPVRSLPADRAATEARRLMDEGYKELVVTGIEISSWGRDLPGKPPLADLIEAICAAAPACRVRLGSLEPRTITEEFCRRVSRHHNLCDHFHLSLQSGYDDTLKRMNRKYDTARYYESVELLRRYYGEPGITTDLIVGFPGETETEFAGTLDFIQKCAFSAMHIFPYSRRTGTPAAAMPGQISKAVKEERARRAAEVAQAMEGAYLRSWVGRTLPVLFEEEVDAAPGVWRGHAPNYTEVRAAGNDLHNIEKAVRITGVDGDKLTGELCGEFLNS